MVDIINSLFGLILIVLGICFIGAFISVGYVMGFRTCQKSYKELISSFEEAFVDVNKTLDI